MKRTRLNQMKFIFVCIVGVFMLGIIINKYVGSNEKEKDTNIESESKDIQLEISHNPSEDDSDSVILDEDKKIGDNESYSNENPYFSIYGKENYEIAEEKARKVVALWIHQNSDKTEWQHYVSSSFFNEIKADLTSDKSIVREIKKLNVSPTEPNNSNEIKLEVLTTWTISNKEQVISKQTKPIYVSLTRSSKEKTWLVTGIDQQ